MIQVVKITPSEENLCLCGSQATEVRGDTDYYGNLYGEEYFCPSCAKKADSMTPEDLI